MRHLLLAAVIATTLIATAGTAATEPRLDGAWALSAKFDHIMGIALKIEGNRYKYWFYSDTFIAGAPRPKYPYTGKLQVRGNTIRLLGRGDYYDRVWHLFIYKNEICLLADDHYKDFVRTGELAENRLLFQLASFDEKNPRMNALRE
jgi:hypothetical protein